MKNIVTLIIGVLLFHSTKGQNALFIPDSLMGKEINLTLQNGTHQFYSGQPTITMGANGNILGPTLVLNQGDFINFTVNNQLMNTTTIHWHGLHVAPENDGGPHTPILPNTTWSPSFTIMDKAATYWYHPHLHHFTNEHVSKGISGIIIVKDSIEAQLSLPRTYGIDDFPLVIQTKDFDVDNQIIVESNADDVVMVNATINPYLDVPSQVVRFRILNGSSQRTFNLGLSNNQDFYQIASDGGLLNSSFQTTRLLLAPGERAEILIDFVGMNGQTTYLKSYASELSNGIYGATYPGMGQGLSMTGYNPNPLNGSDFDIMQFVVVPQTSNPIITVPLNLATVTPIPSNTSNITRTLTFTPVTMGPDQLNGDFLINNASMDINIINYTIPFNNTEIWELINQSAISHPFHIHDVQFYILSRNGVAAPINEQGRKDVVLVKPQETVRFIAKFEDFYNDTLPYMYHCHLLPHEDGGMMGQFIVENPVITGYSLSDNDFTIHPNPTDGAIHITSKKDFPIEKIELFNALGQLLQTNRLADIQDYKLFTNNFQSGVFIIKIYSGKNIITKNIIVH